MDLARKHSARSSPVVMRPLRTKIPGWILALAVVLALLPLDRCFGYDIWEPPSGQPEQMRSKVDYDPKLSDPFFESNEWSYPDNIIKHPDGHFEDTGSDINPEEEPPHVMHTAKCFSTFDIGEHLVKFCEARLLNRNTIELVLHESNVPFYEKLHVRIRNGMFTCQYWGVRDIPPHRGFIWTTKRQELTLDKKVYRKGDVIKGRIDFECLQEMAEPKHVQRYGKLQATIKVSGVFKTILK